MADATIIVEGLRKSFGDVCALDGVDIVVEPGAVLGLLGPNGAGKTTLVRVLSTLLPPDAGHATVAGYDVVREASTVRAVIGLAGQYAAVDGNLTGRENLRLVGRLYHLTRATARRRADELLERFALAEAADRRAKTYSAGMRRRLDLAASLVGRPPVLFLDEPTTGLDPRSRIGLWDTITELVTEGTTVLLTTQYLEEADRLADTIVVIDGGRVLAEGTAEQLKARVGGDVAEVRLASPAAAARGVAALAGLSSGEARVDAESGLVLVPVDSGAAALPAIVRRLHDVHIEIAELAVRRPTLDDVFLSVTKPGDDACVSPSPDVAPSPPSTPSESACPERSSL